MVTLREYETHDALGLAELVKRGAVTPLELVDSAIERIERYNPRVNAVILKLFDRAREAAARDLPDGPFRGVPFLLKDIFAAYAGETMASGSKFYAGWKAPENSHLVDRFLRSGVVVLGNVPLHWNADGLPIGVMLTGRFADEAALFRLAGQLERARPWTDRRPAIT